MTDPKPRKFHLRQRNVHPVGNDQSGCVARDGEYYLRASQGCDAVVGVHSSSLLVEEKKVPEMGTF